MFNSGFLVIDARLIGERPHADLLACAASETWSETNTPYVDQVVLSRVLAGRQTLLGWTYNHLLNFAGAVRRREGLPWRRAKVLHFNLSAKPWMPWQMLRTPVGVVPAEILPAFSFWHNVWLDCMLAAHLRF